MCAIVQQQSVSAAFEPWCVQNADLCVRNTFLGYVPEAPAAAQRSRSLPSVRELCTLQPVQKRAARQKKSDTDAMRKEFVAKYLDASNNAGVTLRWHAIPVSRTPGSPGSTPKDLLLESGADECEYAYFPPLRQRKAKQSVDEERLLPTRTVYIHFLCAERAERFSAHVRSSGSLGEIALSEQQGIATNLQMLRKGSTGKACIRMCGQLHGFPASALRSNRECA